VLCRKPSFKLKFTKKCYLEIKKHKNYVLSSFFRFILLLISLKNDSDESFSLKSNLFASAIVYACLSLKLFYSPVEKRIINGTNEDGFINRIKRELAKLSFLFCVGSILCTWVSEVYLTTACRNED
jgi:hypothetical protein